MKAGALLVAYRRVAQFHENEALIGWLQGSKVVVWLTPRRRKAILCIGAIFAAIAGTVSRQMRSGDSHEGATWLVPVAALPILLGLVYLLYLMAARFNRLPAFVRARPQICVHAFFWVLLVSIWLNPFPSAFAAAVMALVAGSFPYLIWRCGYMVLCGQRGKAAATKFTDHFFYIFPVWDGTNTPPGKGHDNLSRAEAQTAAVYSRSVLAGIKLLLLVALWEGLMRVIGAVVYGDPKSALTGLLAGHHLGIPRLRFIVNGDVTPPLVILWLSLYLELIWECLHIAAKGHVWIGVLRLFGFNVFRNTYKPLLAESVLEFWSRYYYYFKELMVEFFFLPTYLRRFRERPVLRIVVAVFAAAFFGNMYYHLLQAKRPLIDGDVGKLWWILGARLIYCLMLAAGVAVSMLRQQRKRGRGAASGVPKGGVLRLGRIAGVWTFFAIINYWNVTAGVTISERTRSFLSIFGM
ncbi:MAG: hypothetical protein Q8S00_13900 [Deltaproteobacteria bacterium]|nr:hypothetical protein [Deltaproteobacteria bacterium]